MEAAVRLALAAVLAVAAVLKLARPRASAAGLDAFGLPAGAAGVVAHVGVAAAELGLAASVALGSSGAAYAASGLLAVFAAALVVALRRGYAGAPCACFGPDSRVGRGAVVRNVALAAGFAAVPSIPEVQLRTETWLAVGLAVALGGLVLLAVVTAALAREVGLLRLRLTPGAALEVPHEGPPVGERSGLIARFSPKPAARFALAVFASEGCRVCRTLRPAVAGLARDPLVTVEVFDEERDARVWEEANVPGSPFAVALELDGTVRAKGTFNTLDELEGILAAAERRSAEVALA